MAKKNASVSVSSLNQAVTTMVPADSAMSHAEVERKVSKADLVNIMAVGIVSSLEKERDQAVEKIRLAQKDRNDIVNTLKSRLTNILAKEVDEEPIKMKIDMEVGYSPATNKYVITVTDRRINNYDRSLIAKLHSKEIKCSNNNISIVLAKEIVFKQFTFVNDEIDSAYNNLNKLEQDKKEIELRLAKAQDRSFLKAQLDMALLAGSSKGKETASNMNVLIDSLIASVFSKKPAPPQLEQ